MITGVYTITNLLDNKMYVGYAQNVGSRLSKHKYTLKTNTHTNEHLQNAYNKYGKENFAFELLVECEKEHLASEEHYWATILNVHNNKYGYNVKPTHPETQNSVNSPETRAKISASNKKSGTMSWWSKGRTVSQETRDKISIANKGKPGSNKGCHLSEETKQKISKSKLGCNSPRKGIKLTEQAKLKLSLSHKGQIPWNKGKKVKI